MHHQKYKKVWLQMEKVKICKLCNGLGYLLADFKTWEIERKACKRDKKVLCVCVSVFSNSVCVRTHQRKGLNRHRRTGGRTKAQRDRRIKGQKAHNFGRSTKI